MALTDDYDLTKIEQLRTRYDYVEDADNPMSENGMLRVGNTEYYSVSFQANMPDDLGNTIPGYGKPDQEGTGKWYYDIKTQLVVSGERAVVPVLPSGSEIKGWYLDNDLQDTDKWDFDTPITETKVLYGEWLKVGQYTVTFN